MPIPVTAVLGGIEAVKGLVGLFKRRGKPNTQLENAVAVVDSVVTSIQGNSHVDPEAAKILTDHELEMEREYTKQAQATLQVMNTEAASEDPVVRRARPVLMYVGYIIMLSQMIIFPAFKIRLTDYLDREIIYWFYWMFSSGYLGYGVLRSMDKKGMKGISSSFGIGSLGAGKNKIP